MRTRTVDIKQVKLLKEVLQWRTYQPVPGEAGRRVPLALQVSTVGWAVAVTGGSVQAGEVVTLLNTVFVPRLSRATALIPDPR